MKDLINDVEKILIEKTNKILPENIKKGVQIFDVTGTLETGTEINNQDKTITENGTYTADEGYTGLGTVTVNVEGGSGDVKLFKTKEEMQADTSAKEGDLAVVYRSEARAIQNGDTITSITFPKTVVFDTAITDDYRDRLRNSSEPRIYLEITLDDTRCRMYDMYDTIPGIEYTSTDGITYTRTDSNDDTYEIGEITISGLDEHTCKFMTTGANIFGGMFNYATNNTNHIYAYTTGGMSITDGQFTLNTNYAVNIAKSLLPIVYSAVYSLYDTYFNCPWFYDKTNNHIKMIAYFSKNKPVGYGYEGLYYINDNWYCVICSSSDTNKDIRLIDYDISTQNTTITTYSEEGIVNNNYYMVAIPNGLYYIGNNSYNGSAFVLGKENVYYYLNGTLTTITNGFNMNDHFCPEYIVAKNQFTLSSANQLVEGIIGYGEGVIKGDGSIYGNISTSNIVKHYTSYEKYKDYSVVYSDKDLSQTSIIDKDFSDLSNGIITKTYIHNKDFYDFPMSLYQYQYYMTEHYYVAISYSNSVTQIRVWDLDLNIVLAKDLGSEYPIYGVYARYAENSDGTKIVYATRMNNNADSYIVSGWIDLNTSEITYKKTKNAPGMGIALVVDSDDNYYITAQATNYYSTGSNIIVNGDSWVQITNSSSFGNDSYKMGLAVKDGYICTNKVNGYGYDVYNLETKEKTSFEFYETNFPIMQDVDGNYYIVR